MEDKEVIRIQEEVYENILRYAYVQGLITEEERKNGVSEGKLVSLIKKTPKREIGAVNLSTIKQEDRFGLYMPDSVLDALRNK